MALLILLLAICVGVTLNQQHPPRPAELPHPECTRPVELRDSSGDGWSDAHARLALDNGWRECYDLRRGCLVRLYRKPGNTFRAICNRRE